MEGGNEVSVFLPARPGAISLALQLLFFSYKLSIPIGMFSPFAS
jgi:hypothetical protein